jgi:hypothetical protein
MKLLLDVMLSNKYEDMSESSYQTTLSKYLAQNARVWLLLPQTSIFD